jgi:hypothetical protein
MTLENSLPAILWSTTLSTSCPNDTDEQAVIRSEYSALTASQAVSKGGAFPDGVTPGNLKQRRIRIARTQLRRCRQQSNAGDLDTALRLRRHCCPSLL